MKDVTGPIEQMVAVDDDGWSEWIHPLPGYLMQCCDCRLIHEMQVAIEAANENSGAILNEGESADGLVIFRMRRSAHLPKEQNDG